MVQVQQQHDDPATSSARESVENMVAAQRRANHAENAAMDGQALDEYNGRLKAAREALELMAAKHRWQTGDAAAGPQAVDDRMIDLIAQAAAVQSAEEDHAIYLARALTFHQVMDVLRYEGLTSWTPDESEAAIEVIAEEQKKKARDWLPAKQGDINEADDDDDDNAFIHRPAAYIPSTILDPVTGIVKDNRPAMTQLVSDVLHWRQEVLKKSGLDGIDDRAGWPGFVLSKEQHKEVQEKHRARWEKTDQAYFYRKKVAHMYLDARDSIRTMDSYYRTSCKTEFGGLEVLGMIIAIGKWDDGVEKCHNEVGGSAESVGGVVCWAVCIW